jgi:hypothetical protein
LRESRKFTDFLRFDGEQMDAAEQHPDYPIPTRGVKLQLDAGFTDN